MKRVLVATLVALAALVGAMDVQAQQDPTGMSHWRSAQFDACRATYGIYMWMVPECNKGITEFADATWFGQAVRHDAYVEPGTRVAMPYIAYDLGNLAVLQQATGPNGLCHLSPNQTGCYKTYWLPRLQAAGIQVPTGPQVAGFFPTDAGMLWGWLYAQPPVNRPPTAPCHRYGIC